MMRTLLFDPNLLPRLPQHIHQEDGHIPTAPALPGLQQR